MMTMLCHVTILCAILKYSSAHTFYMELLPNGNHVPHPCGKHRVWPGLGHHYPEGAKGIGGVRNAFGIDFVEAGFTWTKELCMKDSDSDGRTNGVELGDPDCTWTKGAVPKLKASSHPGICEPVESENCKRRNFRFGDRLNCSALNDMSCPALTEPGVKLREVRFPLIDVPEIVTTYTCMAYDLPADGDYHLVAATPIVNNTNIVHHIILFGCDFPDNFNKTEIMMMKASPYRCGMTPHPHCQQFLATWTYGVNHDCATPEAGFRIGQHGTRIAALQIHWHNPTKLRDQKDNSGLQLYYTPYRRRFDASVFIIGQQYLEIPPGSSGVTFNSTCPGKCTSEMFKEKIYVTRAINHMHYLGRKQRISLYRNGNKIRDLTNEANYHYDMPAFFYFDPPVEVHPGDDIVTECSYSSDRKMAVYFGEGTHDEMCFGFLTYYPVQDFLPTVCTSWKTVQRCVRKLPKFQGIYDNCNIPSFPAYAAQVSPAFDNNSCGSYQYNKQCNENCVQDSTTLLQHPCLQGDLGEFLASRMNIPIGVLRACANSVPSSSDFVVSRLRKMFIFNVLLFIMLII